MSDTKTLSGGGPTSGSNSDSAKYLNITPQDLMETSAFIYTLLRIFKSLGFLSHEGTGASHALYKQRKLHSDDPHKTAFPIFHLFCSLFVLQASHVSALSDSDTLQLDFDLH